VTAEFGRGPDDDNRPPHGEGDGDTVVVVGKESVGKSALVASLTGDRPTSGNFRGTTVRSERYAGERHEFVDTPGIVLDADTAATRNALSHVTDDDTVLLVVPATDLDRDLADLLPIVEERLGAVVVMFWDKVEATTETGRALERLSADLGVPIVSVDARAVSRPAADGGVASTEGRRSSSGSAREPRGAVPTGCARGVVPRTLVAGRLDPLVAAAFDPLVGWAATLPEPMATVLATQYGLLSMGPFLFVWAGPTLLLFAVVLGAYKTSGLVTRVTVALHPTMRRVGLTGRDLVRIVMGFAVTSPPSSTPAPVRTARGVRRSRPSRSARRVRTSSSRRSRCSPRSEWGCSSARISSCSRSRR